jgi:hypothetical protein
MHTRPKIITAAIAVGGAAALAISLGLSAAQASNARVHRPDASRARDAASASTSYPVTPFVQEFQDNVSPFCPAKSGNLPCSGAVGDYGPVNRAVSLFSNGGAGNYAPDVHALTGEYYAWTAGSQVDNHTACPSTATEYCSGPYALFGKGAAAGVENVFPSQGFTVTDDLYLSPATAPAGNLADDDVELNTNTGTYGTDDIITTCGVTGGIAISFGEGSPGTCGTTPTITKAGWYRFIFEFGESGGANNDVVLTEKVESEPSETVVADSGQQDPTESGNPIPVADAGGPGYFWLPTENVMGLPLANFALQLGDQANGNTP